MKILHSLAQLNTELSAIDKSVSSIGFVPTLGALHEGHMSLIRKSIAENEETICSIFVNPTQFDDVSDFENYPSTIDQDIELLKKNGCKYLFLPSVKEVYPHGQNLETNYQLGELEHVLEGATRPGHYQGVAQVVHRLLNMVKPTILYLGQKDYQQVMIIQKMIKDFNFNVDISICPIIREEDGLAMSSRNRRLNIEERNVSNELFKTLESCVMNANEIPIEKVQSWAIENLNQSPLIKVDYISFRKAADFEPISTWDGKEKLIVLGAIFLGPIRLIDNMIMN